jgi:hypothetical protein
MLRFRGALRAPTSRGLRHAGYFDNNREFIYSSAHTSQGNKYVGIHIYIYLFIRRRLGGMLRFRGALHAPPWRGARPRW